MDIQIWIGILTSMLPGLELKVGLPIVVEYAMRNGFSIWPYFSLIVALDILVVLLIFVLFDFIHNILMKWKWYKNKMGKFLVKLQAKVEKVKGGMDKWGYLALTFFVAMPLPITGSWTGALIVWMMKLDRVKSFIAIAVGIIISGLIVLAISFGVFGSIY